MSDGEDIADSLHEAANRAAYRAGEAELLYAASITIRKALIERDQAVAADREAVAGWLDKLGDAEKWATGREDIATRYRGAAEAVRNGEHVKGEA